MPGADSSGSIAATLPLRDIHLPPAPGWWPPAPGWWGLLVILLLLVISLFLLIRRRRRSAYRRQALRRLAALETDQQLSPTELLTALSALLRRAVLCAYDRKSCAGLSGEAWLQFLDRGLQDTPFSTGPGRCLDQGPYQPECSFDRAELLALCRRWLQKLPPAPRSGRQL